jgi:hypothetical protein
MPEKSFEVYQVDGMTLKPGVFTGRDGKPTKISEDLVEKIFGNINGPIPLYFKHNKLDDFTIKGYASKFAFDPTSKTIQYSSHLYDKQTQQEVALFDCDKVSPEIDFIGDDDNYTNGMLKGIAFVPNPAIDGTRVSVTPMVFSTPDEEKKLGDESSMVNETEFAEMKVKYEALLKDHDKLTKQFEKMSTEHGAAKETIVTLTGERDLSRKEVEKYVKVETDRKTGEVSKLVADLKQIGWDPSGLMDGSDFTLDQQLKVLGQVKAQHMVNKPAVSGGTTPPQGGQSSGGSPDVALTEVIKEMGLSDEYVNMLKGD